MLNNKLLMSLWILALFTQYDFDHDRLSLVSAKEKIARVIRFQLVLHFDLVTFFRYHLHFEHLAVTVIQRDWQWFSGGFGVLLRGTDAGYMRASKCSQMCLKLPHVHVSLHRHHSLCLKPINTIPLCTPKIICARPTFYAHPLSLAQGWAQSQKPAHTSPPPSVLISLFPFPLHLSPHPSSPAPNSKVS